MKTLFCLSDVHSFYAEMIKSLDNAGYDIDNDDHIFVHCGDLLDRGNKPLECLQFINNIPNYKKILIRGNHEDLLEDIFNRGKFLWCDMSNGTVNTVYNLSNIDTKGSVINEELDSLAIKTCSMNYELRKYLNSLKDYTQIGNYIFVHGWIPLYDKYSKVFYTKKDINSEAWKNGDWNSARWFNGMEKWSKDYQIKDKTIVCGHWHTSWGHCYLHSNGWEWDDDFYDGFSDEQKSKAIFEPFIDEGIIALDACTAYSSEVNCYKIEIEDSVWQSSM